MAADVPGAGDAVSLGALRAALVRAGFTAERIEERLGTNELSARPIETAVHLRRLEENDDFSTFARLFLLDDAVSFELVEEAAMPLGVEGLEALGLVSAAGGDVRARVRLVPHGDYLVASDPGPEAGADVPFDHVPGIQAPSVTLAKLAVRRRCGLALDLGTVCGVQGLLR